MGSANGQLIESLITEGKIVPAQITVDLIRKAMLNSKSSRFLIDGFPRNYDNLKTWQSSMDKYCDIETVIFIDCPEVELGESYDLISCSI
jgi:UMP-CMP kinase